MFDFKLTKKGDLDLDYDDSINVPQKDSFVVSDYDVQRIQFVTMPLTVQQKKPADQRISFKLASIDDTSFVEKAVQDDDELVQAIYLTLRTESGDVYDGDAGSNFYQLRHQMVKDDQELQRIAGRVASIINDRFPEAEVEFGDEEYPDAGFFRFQSYIVCVKIGDKKILELPLL